MPTEAQKQLVKIPQAHDSFVKSFMKDIDIARDVLEHHLPLAIQKKIKLETLELEDGSFTDPELRSLHTDILYTVDLADSPTGEKAYIFLHVEHQSDGDPLISFRMIKYCVRILDRHIKNTGSKTLPVIIPLVIFNGKKPFSDSISVFDLFGENQALAQEYMFDKFHLVDMNAIPDEEIRQRKWSCLMEMILKHIHERDMMVFLENLGIIALFQRFIEEMDENSGKDHIISVIKYINEKSSIDDRQRFLMWVNKNLPPKLEKEIMTLAEQWKNEGMQQGMQQGRLEGALEGERTLLKKQLAWRYANIPEKYLDKIAHSTIEQLEIFAKKFLESKTLEDIFESYH